MFGAERSATNVGLSQTKLVLLNLVGTIHQLSPPLIIIDDSTRSR
jgi:hypothetical protein